jgi:hypothetical protein
MAFSKWKICALSTCRSKFRNAENANPKSNVCCSPACAHQHIKEKRRERDKLKPRTPRQKHPPTQEELDFDLQIVEKYKEGFSITQTARILDTGTGTVELALKRQNCPRRPAKSQARKDVSPIDSEAAPWYNKEEHG